MTRPRTPTYHLRHGTGSLLVSIPHGGTKLPKDIAERLNEEGRLLRDTDWHLSQLYNFLVDKNVTVIEAASSRTVIDLNRQPDASPLYPGSNESALCPTTTFDGTPIYRPGAAPDASEIARRLELYWEPYHQALWAELTRIKSVHGFAVLLDAHSIRPRVLRLFDGVLPDLNIGTNNGRACSAALSDLVMACLTEFHHYSSVLNGRFKGGAITRRYGAPDKGVHALQLELSQTCYMACDPPFPFDAEKAALLSPVLQDLVDVLTAFNPGIR